MVSGNLFAASWSAEAASSVMLKFLKPNLFLKLSNLLILALNSPDLDPSSSFCVKLPYSEFAFSQVVLVSVATPFSQRPCTHIKAVFIIGDKKLLHEMCAVFMSASIAMIAS